jgi:hypothetical protein
MMLDSERLRRIANDTLCVAIENDGNCNLETCDKMYLFDIAEEVDRLFAWCRQQSEQPNQPVRVREAFAQLLKRFQPEVTVV